MVAIMSLGELNWRFSTAEDTRIPLHYTTKQVLMRLNLDLENAWPLPISDSALKQALTSKAATWYIPETRELVVKEFEEYESSGAVTHEEKDALKKWIVDHELAHNEMAEKEFHYYERSMFSRVVESLHFVFGEKTISSLMHEAFIIVTRAEESSYPQEYGAISEAEEKAIAKFGDKWKIVSPFTDPASTLKRLEDNGLERGFTCKYLLPFIMSGEFERWRVSIKDLSFRIAYRGVDKTRNGEVFRGPMCVAPDMVWLAAATTEEKDLRSHKNHKSLLIDRVKEYLNSAKYRGPLGEAHEVLIDEVYYASREGFWKDWLDGYLGKHLDKIGYPLYAIMFNEDLQHVLECMFIVWEIDRGRWLCLDRNVANQSEPRFVKLAKGLLELSDRIFTPLFYTLYTQRVCAERPKCSIFRAILDKTDVDLGILPSDRFVPPYVIHQLESSRSDLISQYRWLWTELNEIGRKTLKTQGKLGKIDPEFE
jgi:hypothetical protein